MTRASLVIFLASLAVASAATADTWVRVEKDGTKTYSDRPLPGGTPVVLESAQTYSAPVPQDPTRPLEEQSLMAAANFQYESCSMVPANDQTFQSPEAVNVSLATTPRLRSGDRVRLTIDGTQVGNGEAGTVLSQPDRGSHTATAEVVDSAGKVMCSASTTFHVQRPSLNSPLRQAPPRPTPRPRPTPN
jgi:hypothetical protein